MELYSKRIAGVEGELSTKTTTIRTKLQELKERLVNTSAEEEFSVNIERASYRTVELRQLLKKSQEDLNVRKILSYL